MNKKEKLDVLLETYNIDIIPNKGTPADDVTEVLDLAIEVQPVLETVFKGSAAQAIAMLNELITEEVTSDAAIDLEESEDETSEDATVDLEESEDESSEEATVDLEESEEEKDKAEESKEAKDKKEEPEAFIQDDKLYQLTCNWKNCLYGQTFRGRTVKKLGVPEAHLNLIEG